MEQGDRNKPWSRFIRWKWHAHRRNEIIRSNVDFAFAGSLETKKVSYQFNDGVAVWRVFDVETGEKNTRDFMLGGRYPTMNLYARNVRNTEMKLVIKIQAIASSKRKKLRIERCDGTAIGEDLDHEVSDTFRLDSNSDTHCVLRVALTTSLQNEREVRLIFNTFPISWSFEVF